MENKILVETSARHIHLDQATFDYLMDVKEGEHAELTIRAPLSQPGQYVSTTRLNLVGPVNPKTGKERVIAGVSILGPLRNSNQVEVSATDARTLGVKAPIRQSGDVAGSAPITLVNPENGKSIELKEGVIVAKRHIHMTPNDAELFGVKDNDIVGVYVETEERSLIFADTVVRVSPKFSLAMHIDTDEANAANAQGELYGQLVKLDNDCCCDDDCDCGCGCKHGECCCGDDCDCGCKEGKECTCDCDCDCGCKDGKECTCDCDCDCGCKDGKECTCGDKKEEKGGKCCCHHGK